MKRNPRPAACVVFLLAAALSTAGRGETVVTNEGKSYTGVVTVTPHDAVCVTPEMRSQFALAVVADIELSGAERAEYEILQRKLQPLDSDGLYRMGMWLKSKHQHGMAQEWFSKAVAVDTDHAEARRELGYIRRTSGWEYSPAVHQQAMVDWVGRKALDFHMKMAVQLHDLKLFRQEEQELRRVLQADGVNKPAITMIRPIVAQYKLKNKYRLPFTGTWLAVSGPNLTGHGDYAYMMNAWDFRRVNEKGEVMSGPVEDLKSYFTYDQPMRAPADGEVYEVRDGFPDNPVGTVGPLMNANRLLLKHANGERSVIGHLKAGTFTVKVGDKVKQGQLLAIMGNSGRSATPHLHFAIFDDDGVSLPMVFVDFSVVEEGQRRHVDSGSIELGKVYENRFPGDKGK